MVRTPGAFSAWWDLLGDRANRGTCPPGLNTAQMEKAEKDWLFFFFRFSASLLSSVKLRHYRSKMGFEPVEINPVWQEVCK